VPVPARVVADLQRGPSMVTPALCPKPPFGGGVAVGAARVLTGSFLLACAGPSWGAWPERFIEIAKRLPRLPPGTLGWVVGDAERLPCGCPGSTPSLAGSRERASSRW
jgi:hypothetical protein